MKMGRRKIVLSLFLFLILMGGFWLSFCRLNDRLYQSVLSRATLNQPVLVLDAGHGGMDGGAVVSGIRESDINLSIARKLRDFMTIMGFRVTMIRDGDYSVHDPEAKTVRQQKRSDLMNRLDLLRGTPGALAVSIHQNKFEESYVHGTQVFYGAAPGSEELAEIIQTMIAGYLQPDNERKIKKADHALYILVNNDKNPAVMVECGFLSNPQEAECLQEEDYQKKLAMLIGASLIKYQNQRLNQFG